MRWVTKVIPMPCSKCSGSGKRGDRRCKACSGSGRGVPINMEVPVP